MSRDPQTEFNAKMAAADVHVRSSVREQAMFMGKIATNTLLQHTPPNNQTSSNVRKKRSSGIAQLERKIAYDMLGATGTPPVAMPLYCKEEKRWSFHLPSKTMWSPLGLLLVRGQVAKVGKQRVPYTRVASWMKSSTRVRRHKNRAARVQTGSFTPQFVKQSQLNAAVKRKQKMAGYMLSGWAPAARVFSQGKAGLAPGYHAKLGAPGGGSVVMHGDDVIVKMWNGVQYAPIRANRANRDVRAKIDQGLKKKQKAILASLKKKLKL